MKYRKIDFVFTLTDEKITVMCNKPQIFTWAPLCAATGWLIREECSGAQNDAGATVKIYNKDPRRVAALTQYVQAFCDRCSYNKANKGK